MTRSPGGHSGRCSPVRRLVDRPVDAVGFARRCGPARRLVASLILAIGLGVQPAAADDVRGRVVDPQGRPVAGATVLVLRGGDVAAQAVTRADGQYGPIALAAGEYRLLASTPGLRSAPVMLSVTAGASADAEIRLALTAVDESVVVSAAQVEVPLSGATSSLTVIDRATLDAHQTESAADALAFVPGLHVVQSGGRGALVSIFPRGGESDYTLFLADGVVLNAFGGAFDASPLGTADLERIEVVRGPASALYGGGAIGGIVQLVTRRGGPPAARGGIEGGGYGTWRGYGATSGGRGPWSWGASVDHLASDGDTRELPDAGTRVSNDDYTRTALTASAGWSDRPGRRLRVDVRRSQDERGFPGPYGSDPEGLYAGVDTISRGENDATSAAIAGAFAAPGRLRHSTLLTYTTAPRHFVSPFGASDTRTKRFTARYQADIDGLPAGVSAGVELLRERHDNTFITGEQFQPIPVRRVVIGWFGESRWTLGARGALTAGVRLERIAREALEGNPSPFGPRPDFAEDVVWSASPRLAAAWLARENSAGGWTRLRASASTGIRPPNGFEIAFTDNPGLKPERSRSVDGGVEHALAGGRTSLDATVFFNDYDDLIVSVGSSYAGASRYRTDNISNARAYGLETGLTHRTAWGLHVRAAWTWLGTEILGIDDVPAEAPAPYVVGEALLRRPEHRASLDVAWTHARGSAFATVNGRGSMRDLEPNFASTVYENPGYAAVAIGGAVRLSGRVEVTARITNLFDRDYEEALGFPALGRTAMVGVRVAAGR